MLEEDRNMRYNLASNGELLRQEQLRAIQEREANNYLDEVRLRE